MKLRGQQGWNDDNRYEKEKEMKFATKAKLSVLILVFTLVGALSLLFTPALITPVEAQRAVTTGQYAGNGTTMQVNTGLTSIQSLRIVTVPIRGQASEAYTTDPIQQATGQGTFLNGNKRDSGVALELGNFTVTSPEFNEIGVTYFWEAHGD